MKMLPKETFRLFLYAFRESFVGKQLEPLFQFP